MISPKHQFINTDNPITAGAIMVLAIIFLIALLGWMGNRDRDAELAAKCPRPGQGQQLIGRGYMEADGEPGELQCTYSTAPVEPRVRVATSTL